MAHYSDFCLEVVLKPVILFFAIQVYATLAGLTQKKVDQAFKFAGYWEKSGKSQGVMNGTARHCIQILCNSVYKLWVSLRQLTA